MPGWRWTASRGKSLKPSRDDYGRWPKRLENFAEVLGQVAPEFRAPLPQKANLDESRPQDRTTATRRSEETQR